MARAPRRPARLPFALLLTAACATEPEPEPTGVDVTGPTQRLLVGANATLTAVVQGSGGPLTGVRVSWVSRDTAAVTVDASGKVTAVRAGESWVVGSADTFSDSALVEVAFSIVSGEGRARLRSSGIESTVPFPQPIGIQSEILGQTGALWVVGAFSTTGDTAVFVYFPDNLTATRTQLIEVSPDSEIEDLPNAPFGFLDIYESEFSWKEVPLRGSVEAAVEQAVPGGTRFGRMRLRLLGSGRVYLATDGPNGPRYAQTQQTVDVVTDVLPVYLHQVLGASSGQLTGTSRAGPWALRQATWARTTQHGRRHVLTIWGPPDIRVYLPSPASVDVGAVAQTALAYATVHDSASGYAGTATSGRVDITQYTLPPAVDLNGELRGRVTLAGTGSTNGGAATPFSGTVDFMVPITPQAAAPPAVVPGRLGPAGRAALARWLRRQAGR